MSYSKVKRIEIKNNTVFITSAENFDWQNNWEASKEARKTPEFDKLLLDVLKCPQPEPRFFVQIPTPSGVMKNYVERIKKISRVAKEARTK